ncbi:MAG TPA: hypothetical protein VIO16_15190, partial [Dehalococcoidia bacterium]
PAASGSEVGGRCPVRRERAAGGASGLASARAAGTNDSTCTGSSESVLIVALRAVLSMADVRGAAPRRPRTGLDRGLF